MSIRKARVVGKVVYTPGDGAEQQIPRGDCDIKATSSDVTISWHDGDVSSVATMPTDQYTSYLTSGCIHLIE